MERFERAQAIAVILIYFTALSWTGLASMLRWIDAFVVRMLGAGMIKGVCENIWTEVDVYLEFS